MGAYYPFCLYSKHRISRPVQEMAPTLSKLPHLPMHSRGEREHEIKSQPPCLDGSALLLPLSYENNSAVPFIKRKYSMVVAPHRYHPKVGN